MGEYVESRSILSAGGVLLVVGALVPVFVQRLLGGDFDDGEGARLVLSVVCAAAQAGVAVGAALVGAGVVMRALEQGGVLGPRTDPPEGR
jgi:hypothetical protein